MMMMDRRGFMNCMGAGMMATLFGSAAGASFSAAPNRVPWRAPRGKTVRLPLLTPVPLGAVRPLGWLRTQLG
ncbi:MAG: hypothetical protein ONB15_10475, partial [candidate division KSB1 bacterium]|nr:hypothetical protein [candidate division KSB1 bacterium]